MAKKTVIICDHCATMITPEEYVHKIIVRRRMQMWTADYCLSCATELMDNALFEEKTRKRKVVA